MKKKQRKVHDFDKNSKIYYDNHDDTDNTDIYRGTPQSMKSAF